MAIVLYQNADKTVPTIAARNAITQKIDNMVVVVLDAIADVNAGAGVATYRWNNVLDSWILISKSSKSSYESIKFATEELLISNGSVVPSNMPTDNQIWGIMVLDGSNIIADLTVDGLSVTPTLISGLTAWDGYKLRFTYAYGTGSRQVDLNGRYIENPASGAAGDILYHNGTSYVRLSKGTDGQILTMVNGLPGWNDSMIG